MNKMKRMLMAALMGCVVSASAFAQKQDPNKPPPKIETPKVRTQEKDPPPPPPPKNDDKKKP